MQLFKLVIALGGFCFLFNDQIVAKQSDAIIALAIIFAGFLIGNDNRPIINIIPGDDPEEGKFLK